MIEVAQLLPVTLPHRYSARSLLFPHSFWLQNPCLLQGWSPPTHLHTQTLIYCPDQLSNALPTFCMFISLLQSFLYVSTPLGLLSTYISKNNITFLGARCVLCLLLRFTHLPTSFPYLSFSHLVNCTKHSSHSVRKASRTKKWAKMISAFKEYINKNPNAMCSEWFWGTMGENRVHASGLFFGGNLWKVICTGEDICA